MLNKNEQIQSYLNYYSDMKEAPEYAVMLKGRWGTGKTWFIERFIDEMRAKGVKVLYVSLYGITDRQQIDDEFFRQLHPVLSSKSAAFAGRLLKGVVKGTLKFDWDGDKKEDGTATIAIPDLNLPEYLRDTTGLILVFDDLERCSMPIADVLGYINYFVEHDGQKVLLVCNEEVLLASESDENNVERSYSKIKEKLIGKSFELEPDYAAAIEKFIAAVNLESTREVLILHSDIIKRVYANADYKNLRHLRQAILDFARVVEVLETDVRRKRDLVEHMLTFFLIYSFETKSGTISPGQIGLIRQGLFEAARQKPEEAKTNLYKQISRKYKDVSFADSLLPAELWQSLFETGLINADEINVSLRNSKYFVGENQPDWVKLWNMHDLKDDALEKVLFDIDKRFCELRVDNLGELKHIVSSLLVLSEFGIYQGSKSDVLSIGLKNVNAIDASGKLAEDFSSNSAMLRDSSYGGLGFHNRDSDDFRDFLAKVNELGRKAVELSYPVQAQTMLRLMQDDTASFVMELIHNNYRSAKFADVPILSYIDPVKFVQVLQNLDPKQLDSVRQVFGERYATSHFGKILQGESQWLRKCADELTHVCTARAGKMSAVIFGYLKNSMLTAAEQIDNF